MNYESIQYEVIESNISNATDDHHGRLTNRG